MNGMASFGVCSGGVGVLLIGWRVYETWSPALTERAVYVLGAVLAVVGLAFVGHLFALARERRKQQEAQGWGGRVPARMMDGYGRPVYEQQAPGMPAPIVVQSGSGRSARTEVIYAAPPQYGAQYGGQPGWQPPVQVMQGYGAQGYGYGPPPSANYGPNGFGGGFPGYPQPGGGDTGAFNDATGGNVF